MTAKESECVPLPACLLKTLPLSFLLSLLLFFILTEPVKADPLLLESSGSTSPSWIIFSVGLFIELFVLWLFTRRNISEIIAVCLSANAVTGFIGIVMLMYLRLKGIPILPPGPTFLAAALIEIPLILLMLRKPPVIRILGGVLTGNLITALLVSVILIKQPVFPPNPGPVEDLDLSRNLASIRNAVDEYHARFGFYPVHLIGGKALAGEKDIFTKSDPLIKSGIIESYPGNPYSEYLRTRQYRMRFLLLGQLPVSSPVSLKKPVTDWEKRWFHQLASDSRFGDPNHILLCANGLSDEYLSDINKSNSYRMNGKDYIPGCFFYQPYDFNRDGLPDDYILGAYGWPSGRGSVDMDIIDGASGQISLIVDSNGVIHAGEPDGHPETILAMYVRGSRPR